MRVWISLAALTIAGPASARKNKVPPPQPPTPPVIAPTSFEAPPAGSWVSIPAARRMSGRDGFSRIPGDIITVLLVEQTVTSLDANTSTGHTSDQSASIKTLLGLDSPLALAGGSGDLGISTNRETSFKGSGQTGRGSSVESVVSCTITEIITPINDYKIWCSKQVTINKETQWVVITGRIRARDIQRNNTIPSNLIAHAEIEVAGRGVVADKQRPGLLARVLDKLWPF